MDRLTALRLMRKSWGELQELTAEDTVAIEGIKRPGELSLLALARIGGVLERMTAMGPFESEKVCEIVDTAIAYLGRPPALAVAPPVYLGTWQGPADEEDRPPRTVTAYVVELECGCWRAHCVYPTPHGMVNLQADGGLRSEALDAIRAAILDCNSKYAYAGVEEVAIEL